MNNRRTPLFLLLNSIDSESKDHKEYLPCVKLLLNHHANVNIQDKYGRSCLFHVIERSGQNKLDILKLLLLNSNNLDDVNFFQLQHPYSVYNKGDTTLHCAVRKMNLDIVNMIINKNCLRDWPTLLLIRNNNNETPYDLAQKLHHKSIMECLKITLQLQCNIFLRQKWIHSCTSMK